MTMTDANRTVRLNRVKMLLVVGVFVLPFLAAWLAYSVGWRPGTKSHGEAILPQRSFKSITIRMDDGSTWPWRDSETPRMTLIALSDGPCAKQCINLLALMRNARITLNDKQDRLRLLYLGEVPAGRAGEVLMQSWQHGRDEHAALKAFGPTQPGKVSAILVESNGTALVKYPVGFSPDGLKKDLHKVIR